MKEHPIIFSVPMVHAIFEGRKTMTRRVIKPQPYVEGNHYTYEGTLPKARRATGAINVYPADPGAMAQALVPLCSYGQPGDRLWVRETWAHDVNAQAAKSEEGGPFVYAADGERAAMCRIDGKWRPSIFMPHWASRIILEVTAVRVERVQDITDEDAIAEGCTDGGCLDCGEHEPCGCSMPMPDHRDAFAGLWDSINEKRGYGWIRNPWVWVVEFRRAGAES